MRAIEQGGFARYRSRASVLARSPEEISSLAARAAKKLANSSGLGLGTMQDELAALIGLLKAYANGTYRGVAKRTLGAIAAAVLYFVMPLDVVPDFVVGLGLIDDAAVIAYVFNKVRGEVREFLAWQRVAS